MPTDLTLEIADVSFSLIDSSSNFGYIYAPESTDALSLNDKLAFVLFKSGGGFVFQSDSMSFQDFISSLLNIDSSPLEIVDEYLSFGDDCSLLMTLLLD